jgi:class 3 adenylate cyclase
MSAESISHDTEIASVLFVDMVRFTDHSMERQNALLSVLQRIVKESEKAVLARAPDELITITTGDGMALVFFRGPVLPAMCALEIAGALRQYPEISVRMGVNMGLVYRHLNIKEQVDVVGGGINTAQRIMDCGDAGHILVSYCIAEVLAQLDTGWHECLRDLGVHEVKNGARVHLFNLCKDGLGNPETPKRIRVTVQIPPPAGLAAVEIRRASRWKWLRTGSIAAVFFIGGLIVQQKTGIFHLGTTPSTVSTPGSTGSSPSGTAPAAVSLTIAEASQFYITLDSDVPADGSGSQTLSFTVRDDLKVGDTVVIAQGAKVIGSILWSKKMFGLSKKMNFQLMQAVAADGQKLKVRATLNHAGKGPDSRPFDTGKGSKSKDLAAAKGTEYMGYTDGAQTVSVQR